MEPVLEGEREVMVGRATAQEEAAADRAGTGENQSKRGKVRLLGLASYLR